MTYNIDSILEELYGLQRLGIKVGLKHTVQLLDKIGNPHNKLKLIHIAGTNGKGSTCSMLSDILIEHGLKVGLYTSPHLVRFNERIQVNGNQISDNYIAEFFNKNREHINSIKSTFFETTTALALDYFNTKSVDIAIVETGLGGRLDSTNVISPIVCGITAISYDHTDILGDTLEKISEEKAGIIKEGTPVATFEQKSQILKVIDNTCREKNTSLEIIQNDEIIISKVDEKGTRFHYSDLDIELPLFGDHQVQNCSLAICLSKYALGSAISSSKIKTAISKSIWKGRLEKISNNNLFYDVAHNYEGIKAMLNTINVLYPNKEKVGLFCIKSDKNIFAICKLLKNNFKKLILCSDKNGYLVKASDLLSIMNKKNIECFSVESVDEGVSLLNEYDKPNYINLVFGSHYVASEVYSSIEKYFDRTYN